MEQDPYLQCHKINKQALFKGDGGPVVAQQKREKERKRERVKKNIDRFKDLWKSGKGGEGGGEGRGGEVRGGFEAVRGRARGGNIGFQCKVVVQVLGGEEKGGGVVVDFVVG